MLVLNYAGITIVSDASKSFPCNRTELYVKVISIADISKQANTLLIFLEVEFDIVAKHPLADMTYQIGLANLPSAIYQKYLVWFITQKKPLCAMQIS